MWRAWPLTAWAHGHMPCVAGLGIWALVCALVARVTEHVFLLSVQQTVALGDIGHIARGASHGVHQA